MLQCCDMICLGAVRDDRLKVGVNRKEWREVEVKWGRMYRGWGVEVVVRADGG